MGLFSKTSKRSQGTNVEAAAQNTTEKPKSKFGKFFSRYKKLSSSADKTKISRFASLEKQVAAMMPKHLGKISAAELADIQNNPAMKKTLGLMGDDHTEQVNAQIKKIAKQDLYNAIKEALIKSKPNASKKIQQDDILYLGRAAGLSCHVEDIEELTNNNDAIVELIASLDNPTKLALAINNSKYLQALLVKQPHGEFANLLRCISGSSHELVSVKQAASLFDSLNTSVFGKFKIPIVALSSLGAGIVTGVLSHDAIHDSLVNNALKDQLGYSNGGYSEPHFVRSEDFDLIFDNPDTVYDASSGKFYRFVEIKDSVSFHEVDINGKTIRNMSAEQFRDLHVNTDKSTRFLLIEGKAYIKQFARNPTTDGLYQIDPTTGDKIAGGDVKLKFTPTNSLQYDHVLFDKNGNVEEFASNIETEQFHKANASSLAAGVLAAGTVAAASSAKYRLLPGLGAHNALKGDKNILPAKDWEVGTQTTNATSTSNIEEQNL
jgi:hypothetical protein